jgi:hypothetical protein
LIDGHILIKRQYVRKDHKNQDNPLIQELDSIINQLNIRFGG